MELDSDLANGQPETLNLKHRAASATPSSIGDGGVGTVRVLLGT